MSKLRLNRATARAEEGENPYRFPVEAARQLGSDAGDPPASPGRGQDASGGVDVITQIEDALDRMQNRLEDLSDQIGSLRFPGTAEDGDEQPDPGPSAA